MSRQLHTGLFVVPALCFAAIVFPNRGAAEIVYIEKSPAQSYTRQQLETAARFLGLKVDTSVLVDSRDSDAAMKAIRNSKTCAVVINANALPVLDKKQVWAALLKHERPLSLLIAGITEQSDPALVSQWSAGTITSVRHSLIGRGRGSYEFAKADSITGQLGGNKLPLNEEDVSYFTIDTGRGARWLMAATTGGVQLPVFTDALVNGREIFLAVAARSVSIPVTSDPYRQQAIFATLAPQIMFLRYAAGERAWHSLGSYANLTIDDLWLREPYGHVNYEGLLSEMKRHNFHTTVAFVPWNFDRNQAEMISLFQAHPDRFSIGVHGNNHDHQEFGPYETHALQGQVANVKQGLARMEKFSQLTHIPYDKVMVFPHSIAPERTLGVLKAYNYLATANSLNVPSDAEAPSDPGFVLRTVSMVFADFPSLRRYSAEAPIPEAQLAIDAFLNNPMLFYAHQAFFASGNGAFNQVADKVNRLQPGTQWRSLGYVARHLYLERLRDDGDYDIRAYTGALQLKNVHQHDAGFFVEKEEDFRLPVTAWVDGRPHSYEKTPAGLRLKLRVRAGMSREVEIKYENDLKLAEIDCSKPSLRINTIRYLSDFRDNVVSKNAIGRRFIRSYGDSGSAWIGAIGGLTVLFIAVTGWVAFRGKFVRGNSDPKNKNLSHISRKFPRSW